jgi:hypothetical protein
VSDCARSVASHRQHQGTDCPHGALVNPGILPGPVGTEQAGQPVPVFRMVRGVGFILVRARTYRRSATMQLARCQPTSAATRRASPAFFSAVDLAGVRMGVAQDHWAASSPYRSRIIVAALCRNCNGVQVGTPASRQDRGRPSCRHCRCSEPPAPAWGPAYASGRPASASWARRRPAAVWRSSPRPPPPG